MLSMNTRHIKKKKKWRLAHGGHMAVAKLSIFDIQRFLRIAVTHGVRVLLNAAFLNCRLDYF